MSRDDYDFNDEQLIRYSRQIMLPAFDVAGQSRLATSRVLIIGLGGLGSPIALYLAAAGVGTLHLADFDEVDLSNLQRQISHTMADLGDKKVESAKKSITQINPEVNVITQSELLDEDLLLSTVSQADVVVDATDNFATRFAINQACVKSNTPLVSGAAIRMEGQVSVFDTSQNNAPCYQCLYSDISEEQLSCSEAGVMAPLVGIIGSVQAMETVKILSGMGQPLTGKLLVLDAMTMEWRTMKLKKDPQCQICSKPA
ncbi:HesA/MoeB/ThiF family protein [Alkalimarinus sediminis]|uniref:Molybdopterin-synthase adenylyltransferase n=1 Tax=Alkalimarinus sediminis TaxID=1632866 RepID=A0A9E8HGB1_9ALTE|nr:molybdopterin-synthase adenylyltransferase MoeB [Alkalimarinus sediminis]UZW74130.1 molybdopterin-synthase adenylyltransferase MoeB [Alkalimarinus sediminis]